MWKLLSIKNVNVNDFDISDVSGVFIINCKHISNFVLTVDFEQANVSMVHIETQPTHYVNLT